MGLITNKEIVKIMKTRKAGRVELSCRTCGKKFSTHSSNREVCHSCKPKCGERHYFDPLFKRMLDERRGKLKDQPNEPLQKTPPTPVIEQEKIENIEEKEE